MRRIQNRGYLTLSRLVAHLDRLAVGDESNAAIDASDAVNLMTIHAAKGLEFPVVFLVNMSRGTGNRRPPMRVALETGGAEASVSVGDFQSEADDDRQAKEREETKRLLYVALTRARDRVYLSSLLKDGAVPRSAGSLAEVLPPGLLECFSAAAGQAPRRVARLERVGAPLRRVSASGRRRTRSRRERRGPLAAGARQDDTATDDLAPLDAAAGPLERRRRRRARRPRTTTGARAAESDALLGTLVHRLIQRLGVSSGRGPGRRRGGGPAGRSGRRQRGAPGSAGRRGAGRRPLRARAPAPAGGGNPTARPRSGTRFRSRRPTAAASCAARSTASPGRGPARSRCSSSRPAGPAHWHQAQLRLYRRGGRAAVP